MYTTLTLLASTLAVSSAKLTLTDIPSDYHFNRYLQDFRIKHNWTESEYASRQDMFKNEVVKIQRHNVGQSSYKIGLNRFSVMTKTEKKTFLGHSKAVRQAHTEPKHLMPSGLKMKRVQELPTQVDWRNTPNVVSSVKDQGHCGSCWAFSATETLESHIALATGLLYDLSPQQIAMCSPNPNSCGGTGGCQGATTELGFEYIAEVGVVEEYQIGYNAYYGADTDCAFNKLKTPPVATIQGYTKLTENSYDELMNAVAQVGPVAVVVDASEWHNYAGGVFNSCNQENPDLNHGVVVVGYGEETNGQKYWTVRNSWSPSYGEAGYIRVARTDKDAEVCGWDITPLDGTACAGDTTPVKACGTCGILYDVSYPIGSALR